MRQTWLDSHNLSSAIFRCSLTYFSITLFYLYLLDCLCFEGFTMIRFFLLIGFLSNTSVSREVNPGNCENTILENLAGFINTSSSHLTKEVLTTFFLRANGESRFNITKERKCKDYGQNYQQVWNFCALIKNYLTSDPESDRCKGIFIWCCIIHLHVFFSS